MRVRRVVVALVLGLGGCTAAPTMSATGYYEPDLSRDAAQTGESLFRSDQQVLPGDDIERILGAQVRVPQQAKLVVMQFGQRNRWFRWSEEFAKQDQETVDGLLQKLATSKRLAKVLLLPSLLTPERQSIPYLREAAARCQADLLLVYASGSVTYEKYKFLSPNVTKARCTVEAILLDVRTGLVPFTSVATQEYEAKKTSEDMTFEETIARGRAQAERVALGEIADSVIAFLAEAP